MSSPRLKTRSDYHHLSHSAPSAPVMRVHRWVISLFYIALGFVVGLFFENPFKTLPERTIMLSSVDEKVNKQKNKAPQVNKGARTSSKA